MISVVPHPVSIYLVWQYKAFSQGILPRSSKRLFGQARELDIKQNHNIGARRCRSRGYIHRLLRSGLRWAIRLLVRRIGVDGPV